MDFRNKIMKTRELGEYFKGTHTDFYIHRNRIKQL